MWNPFSYFNKSVPKGVVDISGLGVAEADAKVKATANATHVYVDGHIFPIKQAPLGDGNAEFLGEGSQEEFEEQEKRDKGQYGWFGTGK